MSHSPGNCLPWDSKFGSLGGLRPDFHSSCGHVARYQVQDDHGLHVGLHTSGAHSAGGSPCESPSPVLHLPSLGLGDTSHSHFSSLRHGLDRFKNDVAKLSHSSSRAKSVGDVTQGLHGHHNDVRHRFHDNALPPRGRRITVDYSDICQSDSGGRGSNSHGNRRSLLSGLRDNGDSLDSPHHNFSLVMTSLHQGMFSGELSLKDFPEHEDIAILIHDSELEIFLDKSPSINGGRRHHCDKKHRVCIPYHYGVVDLPIFVDPKSVTFAHDSSRNVLVVNGRNKGPMFSRRRSLSLDQLPVIGHDKKWTKNWICKRLGINKSRSHENVVVELASEH